MVDATKNTGTEQIGTTTNTGMDQDLTPVKMLFPATSDTFREIREAIFSNINDPQVDAKKQRTAVDALLQQLQTAIDEENSNKTQEINELKDIMAHSEQLLAKMIKSGKSQSL